MLRPLFFRTRSPERDSRTDAIRREAIVAVIERQRAEAIRERDGLSARMDDAYRRATALIEASAEYADRAREDEEAIRAFEASAEAARRRKLALEAEIALFDQLLSRLGAAPGGAAPSEPQEGTK